MCSRKPSSLSTTNQVNNNNNQKDNQKNLNKSSTEKTYCNMNPGRVNACMIKTFNRMKKRIGFLIYQFVLPAIQVCTEFFFIHKTIKKQFIIIMNNKLFSISFPQVSLFCLAIVVLGGLVFECGKFCCLRR